MKIVLLISLLQLICKMLYIKKNRFKQSGYRSALRLSLSTLQVSDIGSILCLDMPEIKNRGTSSIDEHKYLTSSMILVDIVRTGEYVSINNSEDLYQEICFCVLVHINREYKRCCSIIKRSAVDEPQSLELRGTFFEFLNFQK